MRHHARPAAPANPIAVAEELAWLLVAEGWHDYEALSARISAALCHGHQTEPCPELLRLHIYGRLQNWVQLGFLEQRGDEYHATGAALRELNGHTAANHCQDLLSAVAATGKLLDFLPQGSFTLGKPYPPFSTPV